MPKLPRVSPAELVRALRRAGFEDYRQKGSHLTLFHPGTRRNVTVPMHSRDLSAGITHAIITRAGLSVDEFRQLLA